ncbi:RHS repeat-associated core domain-containing protein, partial [Lihuaxuella thermophila]
YTYDADNKLKTVAEPNSNQTDYTYDKNGNVTQRKYTAGTAVTTHDFAYNSLNQLIRIKENGQVVGQFTYNETDQEAGRKTGDGTSTVNKYNGAGDLVEQMIIDKNGEIIDSFQYTYDAKGNITRIVSKAGTTSYVYDELDQLIKETRPDGTIYEYTYDAVGNRLTKKVTQGGNTTTTTYTYDDADQLTAVNGTSYTYDANGNLISDGNRTYVYDAENRLTAVKDSSGATIASFTYRADGMRKTMTTSSGTITFHYDENKNVTYETDGSNNIVARYTYNSDNLPVSMTRGGKTYYYQLNYRGDVVALTDANGAVVATYEYDAYGNLIKETGTVENPYRYAGYRYDKVTGFYYLQSRYYNPDTGSFLTRDTFEGEEKVPLSQNRYTYAHNNPVMNTDPTGYVIPVVIAVAVRIILRALYYALLAGFSNAFIGYLSTGKWEWKDFWQGFGGYFVLGIAKKWGMVKRLGWMLWRYLRRAIPKWGRASYYRGKYYALKIYYNAKWYLRWRVRSLF